MGRTVCSTDTGNYCRARLQIPFQAVREIAIQLANDVEATVEGDTVFAEQEACWLVELDIRSIKCSLGMDVIRGKTPEMVRTEFWSCLLAYNLIRAKNWCHIRTTNPIESTFATIRPRHRKTKNNGSAKASLVMIFELAQSDSKGWRKLRGHQHIPEVIKGVRFIDGVIEQSADEPKSTTTKSPTNHTEIVA